MGHGVPSGRKLFAVRPNLRLPSVPLEGKSLCRRNRTRILGLARLFRRAGRTLVWGRRIVAASQDRALEAQVGVATRTDSQCRVWIATRWPVAPADFSQSQAHDW